MPERAWTTCVSNGAISGLARSNYVPFAPQPLPPGMTEAMYELLDPGSIGFGAPPPDDCFPRYVMWREERIPDFDGGQPRIDWTRNLGWDFRNDCAGVPFVVDFTALPNPVDLGDGVTFTPIIVSGGVGPFLYQWQFEVDILWDNLRNYWYLDEVGVVRRDSKRFSHLTPVNNPTTVIGVGGKNATAFDNLLEQYLAAEPHATLDLSNGATWLYFINIRTGAPVLADGAAFMVNGATFHSSISFGTANVSPLYQFAGTVEPSGDTRSGAVVLGAYDTWYFVAGRYDAGLKKPTASLNAGPAIVPGSPPHIEHPNITAEFPGMLIVGASQHLLDPRAFSKAYIQALAFFDAYLSDAQLAEIYNGGVGKFFPGSTEEMPVWTYPTIGLKHVTLTVTDSLGATASAAHDVLVQDAGPPEASVYFTWDQMTEDTLLFFDLNVVGSLDILSIDWDFGEGAGWELDLGEPIVNAYPGGVSIPESTFTVKVRVNAVEGIFEDEAEMTTNYAFGQSGSSL
jgi:hypothetical protein